MEADIPPAVPDLDWAPERARAFGDRILDLYAGLLSEIADGPASPQVTTAGVRAAIAAEVPEEPLGDEALLAHLQAILDHSLRPGSGGFLAYISGAGTVPGALVDVLASGLNPNVGGWMLSPAATEVELQLVRWLCGRFGLPPGSGGQLVSGGSLANLSGLKLARDRADESIRLGGVANRPPLTFYATTETHFTVDRAADVLGLGEAAVRKVAVDARLSMRASGRQRSSPRPARPERGRSTPSTRSQTSRSASAPGCTSMLPTAAPSPSPTRSGRFCAGSSGPTRSPSTRTSGSMRPR